MNSFVELNRHVSKPEIPVSTMTRGHVIQTSLNPILEMLDVQCPTTRLATPVPLLKSSVKSSSETVTNLSSSNISPPPRTTPDLLSINTNTSSKENAPSVELDAPVSSYMYPHTPLIPDFCELPGLEFTVPSPHPSVTWSPLELSRPVAGSTQLAQGDKPVAAMPWSPVQVEMYIEQGYKVPPSEISVCDPEDIRFITNADGKRWRLGAGSFGSVEGANLTKEDGSTVEVAVKSFSSNIPAPFVREARLQAYLSDTGVFPKFHGALQLTEGPNTVICQVSELFAGGKTLQNLLVDIQASGLHLDFEWVAIALQLATGLQTIHKHGVIYNDLKEDNVLVNVSVVGLPDLRYIDLGLATFKEGFVFRIREEEFERYPHIAPEVRKGEHTTFLSDIWSLGATLTKIAKATKIEGLKHVAEMAHRVDPAERFSLEEIITSMEEIIASMQAINQG